MKLAIMQPYFFPYIGYWQLINAVDRFIVFDDVNYIVRGYINRNYILLNNSRHRITLELKKASRNKLISDIEINTNSQALLKTIRLAYKKAPYFNDVFELIVKIMKYSETNLARFLTNLIKNICEYIGITTEIIESSSITKTNSLKSQEKIIEICKIQNTHSYINAIGGKKLYKIKIFNEQNIELFFMKSDKIEYEQFSSQFVPWLSIIDVLMFNDIQETKNILLRYSLERG